MTTEAVQSARPVAARLAVWFSVAGDMKYLSHRETMTLWERALSRAQIGVSFSQGFNPHMQISMPLPRSVGVSSLEELLLVRIAPDGDLEQTARAIAAELPVGITLLGLKYVPVKLSSLPQYAEYRLAVNQSVDRDILRRTIADFHNCRRLVVERQAHNRHPRRKLDLKAHLAKLEMSDASVTVRIITDPGVTARISEVVEALGLNKAGALDEITRIKAGYADELLLERR